MLSKAFDILSSSAAATITDEDESRSYGTYIGNKLRLYSAKTRSAVIHAIGDIIFRADQGMFEPNILHNQNNMCYPNPYLPQSFPSVHTPLHPPASVYPGPNSDPLPTNNCITPTESTSSVYPNISPILDQIPNEIDEFNHV